MYFDYALYIYINYGILMWGNILIIHVKSILHFEYSFIYLFTSGPMRSGSLATTTSVVNLQSSSIRIRMCTLGVTYSWKATGSQIGSTCSAWFQTSAEVPGLRTRLWRIKLPYFCVATTVLLPSGLMLVIGIKVLECL